MERDRAQELDVEGDHVPGGGNTHHLPALSDQTPAGLFDDRERLRKEILLGLAGLEPGAEVRGLLAERLVRKLAQASVVLVDFLDERPHALDVALMLRPEDA